MKMEIIDYDATEWYLTFKCPKCKTEVRLYKWMDQNERKCNNCGLEFFIVWNPCVSFKV